MSKNTWIHRNTWIHQNTGIYQNTYWNISDDHDTSDELKHAAECVLNQSAATDTDIWPLEVRKNVTLLLMEFYRPSHGRRIEILTEKGDLIADLLRVEDSFLPDRITRMINKISMAHTMTL